MADATRARRRSPRARRWPHALLVDGPRGIGKRALALQLRARAAVRIAARRTAARAARARAAAMSPPASIPICASSSRSTVDDDGDVEAASTAITIDRIRALIDWAQLTSHRGVAKVAVIAPAERMNAAAANALLKTLEEPPPGTYLHPRVRISPGALPRDAAQPLPAARGAAADARRGARVACRAGRRRRPSCCSRRPAARRWPRSRCADAAWQAERARVARGARQRRERCRRRRSRRASTPAAQGRAARAARARDRLARSRWTRRSRARRAPAARRARNPGFRRGARARSRRRWRRSPLFRYHRSLLRQRALVAHPLQPRLVAEALLIDYRSSVR